MKKKIIQFIIIDQTYYTTALCLHFSCPNTLRCCVYCFCVAWNVQKLCASACTITFMH